MENVITKAWKLTLNPAGLEAFPDSPPIMWTVRLSDGSGNLVSPDGSLMYAADVPFDHEPSSHMDPHWVTIEEVDPASVPSAQ